jgi:cellulose synthase operon protein C
MRLNLRFLACLLVCLGIGGIALFGLNRFQLSKSSSRLLSEAKKAKQELRLKDAESLLARYLMYDGSSVDALVELADTRLLLGDNLGAYTNYEKALRLDPSLSHVRRELALLSLLLDRFADAKTHATSLRELEPNNPEYSHLSGLAERGLGDYKAAWASFQSAVSAKPNEKKYVKALVDLLTDDVKDLAAARSIVDEAAKQGSAEMLTLRGEWLLLRSSRFSDGNNKLVEEMLVEAWNDAQKILQKPERDSEATIFAVNAAIATQRIDEARKIIASAIETTPANAKLYGTAAQVELEFGDTVAAIAYLKAGLKEIPGEVDLLWNLAQLEIEQGDTEVVRDVIVELRAKKYDEAAVRYLEARLLIKEGQWRKAISLIEESRALFDRNGSLLKQIDFLLANCFRNIGNQDQQLLALRRIIGQDPLWFPAREALADALVRSGFTQEAIAEYWQIVQMPQSPVEAAVALAQLLFVNNLGQGTSAADWDSFNKILDLLKKNGTIAPQVALLEAEVCVAEGRVSDALDLLKQNIELYKDNQKLWLALISLHLRNKNFALAEEVISDAKIAIGDSPEIRFEQARLLLQREGEDVNREEVQQLGEVPDTFTELQKAQHAVGFTALFLSIQDYERCESYARRASETEVGKSSIAIQLLLFDLAFRSNSLDSMSSALEQVKEIEGTGPLWRVGKAVQLSVIAGSEADKQKANELYSAAITQLTEAAVSRGAWALIPKLRGEIYDRQGEGRLAVDNFLAAINLGERNPQLIARAIYLLYEQNRFVEADEVVRKLQEQQTPFSLELTQVASQVSLQLENFDRALSLAQDWARKSNKQADHVWLAQVYAIANQIDDAAREFKVAIDMDPKAASPWVSLVQMYSRVGNIEKAEQILIEAEQQIANDVKATAMAQCYDSLKNNERADHFYSLALVQDATNVSLLHQVAEFYLRNAQNERAISLLKKIVALDKSENFVHGVWANRNLALLLDASNDLRNFDEAKNLLTSNIQRTNGGIDDLRAYAIVLSGRPEMEHAAKATELLESVVKQQAHFSLADNFLLAQMYAKTGRLSNYTATMRRVLGNGGANEPKYVRAYADQLLSQNESVEARLWIDRLKELDPSQIESDTLEVKLLIAAKDFSKLQALLLDRRSNPERLEWCAGIAEAASLAAKKSPESKMLSQKFMEISRASFLELSKLSENGKLQFAAFLSRRGELEAAFEEVHGSSLPRSAIVADLTEVALRAGEINTDGLNTLITQLKAELANSPNDDRLLTLLGDVFSWNNEIDQSLQYFQLALERKPGSLFAINNSAMIRGLALREIDAGMKQIQNALSVYGTHYFLIDTRGILHLASQNFDAAESDFRYALNSRESPDVKFHLAFSLAMQNRKDDAQKLLSEAIDEGLSESSLHPLERPRFLDLVESLNNR